MSQSLVLPLPGTLGNITGGGSDGVHLGALTFDDPSKVLLKSVVAPSGLCITDDGGLYVNETTPFNESTGDDVEVLPATPAVDDAAYFGLAGQKFGQIDLDITTQGDGTWTITWEYWNGTAWTALSGVTDGTTGFTAATGEVSVTFTVPSDWEENTVDSVEAYWVRANVSAFTAVTTSPQVGQGWIRGESASWTDDTTDFTDAGTGDVDLLPSKPKVGDGIYLGHAEKFCKVKVTTSQARTGTATITLKYWDGDSWEAVTTLDDDSVGWSATAGTHTIHFVPPSDWVANTASNGPNGQAGFFVVMELTALTDVTAQPQATQGWVLPMVTGGDGFFCPVSGTVSKIFANAHTNSATNADSVFLLVNVTSGKFVVFTWTKGDQFDSEVVTLAVAANDGLAVVQITEDGTTEFADASMQLRI